ncbi:hypothetical protein [Aerosakkonema funiforme]|uniref:hypothetical protein n=1 Tax=Aerosakkonema funiforme TaxID=1246630 RepID=UPI0035BA2D3F
MKIREKNWLEWVVFGMALLMVVSTLGYLIYDAATLSKMPPAIQVQLGEPQPIMEHFIVPVSVTNQGDRTAEGVQIEVTLESTSKEKETAQFEIAFLPRRAKREGWVTFETDPRTAKVKARALGYEKP